MTIVLLWAGVLANEAVAQSSSAETIIAVTKSGAKLKAPATLEVSLFPLDIQPHKIKICLQNQAPGYVKIELLDWKGNRAHQPVFVFEREGIVKYDMSQMPAGDYIIRINNKKESQEFELNLSNWVTPVIEVKKGILANNK